MKQVILNIPENKFQFFMEVLKNFSFVNATQITATKADFLIGLKSAVEEVKLAKQEKLKTTSLNDFLDELPN